MKVTYIGLYNEIISSGIEALGTNFTASADTRHTVYNGFGNDYMKATIIVAGGLTGGISSTIAGGNFWQGMRQGLIVSGLNHLAHLGLFIGGKSLMRQAIEAADENPDRDASVDDAPMLMEKVSLLKSLGAGKVEFKGYETTGEYGFHIGNKVYINTNKLYNKTLLDYATTIYHEIRHNAFVVSGIYSKMKDSKIEGRRLFDIITGKHGFDEYQAAKSTSLVAEGKHLQNELLLIQQHTAYITSQNFSISALEKIYFGYGGKY